MAGEASRRHRDSYKVLNDGMAMAAGTNAGTPIRFAGVWPWRKLLAQAILPAGATATFFWTTATSSAGPFATFTSPNQTASAASMTATNLKNVLSSEIRGEAIEDLATRGYYLRCNLILSGTVAGASFLLQAFLHGDLPASDHLDPAVSEVDFDVL